MHVFNNLPPIKPPQHRTIINLIVKIRKIINIDFNVFNEYVHVVSKIDVLLFHMNLHFSIVYIHVIIQLKKMCRVLASKACMYCLNNNERNV
jgi:hypothetical protein